MDTTRGNAVSRFIICYTARAIGRRPMLEPERPIIAEGIIKTPGGNVRRESKSTHCVVLWHRTGLKSTRGVILWPRIGIESALGVVLCPRAGLKSALGVVLLVRLRRHCPTAMGYRARVKVSLAPVSPARLYQSTTASVFIGLVRVKVPLRPVSPARRYHSTTVGCSYDWSVLRSHCRMFLLLVGNCTIPVLFQNCTCTPVLCTPVLYLYTCTPVLLLYTCTPVLNLYHCTTPVTLVYTYTLVLPLYYFRNPAPLYFSCTH
jgi:hypothetical protein